MRHLRQHWTKYLAFLGLAAAVSAVLFGTGLNDLLSVDALALRYGALNEAVLLRPVWSALLAVGLYALFVTLAIPGAWLLSVAYGLLFGWAYGLPIVMAGALIGSSAQFWAARTAFADYFRKRAGDAVSKLSKGFRENAASYLLFLRFMPMFPFVIINTAPAMLGVSYRTFLWTSLVGLAPASLAYTFAGEQMGDLFMTRATACVEGIAPCGEPLSAFEIISPGTFAALGLLALTALLPVALARRTASR